MPRPCACAAGCISVFSRNWYGASRARRLRPWYAIRFRFTRQPPTTFLRIDWCKRSKTLFLYEHSSMDEVVMGPFSIFSSVFDLLRVLLLQLLHVPFLLFFLIITFFFLA